VFLGIVGHPFSEGKNLLSADKMCTNIMLGIRYNNPKRSAYFSKIGIGFRYYTGTIPTDSSTHCPALTNGGGGVDF
jgi:hypothetical protein